MELNSIVAIIGFLLSVGTFFLGRQSIAKKEGILYGSNAEKIQNNTEKVLQLESIINLHKDTYEKILNISSEKISNLEIKLARSEQDRSEIHRMIERIDNTKASKEVVDGFRNEIASLRFDMDKRFDRIERILEGKKAT